MSAGPQELSIRLAAPHELPLVHELMRDGFAEYRHFQNPSSALSETLEDVVRATERGGAVLAFRAEQPIACARFEVRPSDQGGVLAFSRMVVVPKERRRGVGRALVRWLEDLGRSKGLSACEITVRSQQPDNRPYYERLGYRVTGYSQRYGIADMVTYMKKSLGDS